MLREAELLAQLDPDRVAIKLPATPQGYAAAGQLAAQGLHVTLTAVYTVSQAVLAQAADARYIAVYLGRMRDQGLDPLELVGRMQRALDAQGARLDILAASVSQPDEVEALAELGVSMATLPISVLRRLPESEQTAAAAAAFLEDARAIQ
jgi:transaldolase